MEQLTNFLKSWGNFRSRLTIPKIVWGSVITFFGVVFAFLALFPEKSRTEWFCRIGIISSDQCVAATLAPLSPTTPITNTPTLTDTPPTAPTPLPPSQTPAPPSVSPTTPPPDTPSGSNQLILIADQDSLTLYVSEQTDLAGLTFTNDQERTYELASFFGGLILTNGIAEAGSCFRLNRNGSTPPLATVCQNRTRLFTAPVGDSDVFWYDKLQANFRVVEVRRDDELIGRCTFAESKCNL